MCHSQTKIRGKSKLFVKRSRTKQATIEDKKGKCNQRKSARGKPPLIETIQGDISTCKMV